jgi:hypothetical protein
LSEAREDRSHFDADLELRFRRKERFEIFLRRDVITAFEIRKTDGMQRVWIAR